MARRHDTREPKHTHCAECARERRRPAKGHQSAIDAWLYDEFCSTECAKAYHGKIDAALAYQNERFEVRADA